MPTFVEELCPRCGAPLPARAATGIVHCEYCATELIPEYGRLRLVETRDEDLPDPDRPRLWIGGRRYVLLGRLARGECSDVHLGRRDHRLTEQVVVAVLRDPEHRERLAQAWSILEALQRSTRQGRDHFTRLLPQPVAHGEARLGLHGTEGSVPVSVFRHAPGFIHTLEDVRQAYPRGVAPEAAVWLWKRIVELLAWLHQSDQVHGGVLPEHLLIHARDHGVRLVGWSRSVRAGEPLPAFTAARRELYPEAAWAGGEARPATDLTMAARCIRWTLGDTPAPPPLDDLLERWATGEGRGEGWALLEAIDAAARQAFGPPRYVPFPMPGWPGLEA
ncbi:MAG: hypothetical protein P1V51_09385 [Deltaproteobacteria bacterium]|nr:hypothetical protein [Deltaproteobacteria bacterium]